MKKQLLQIGVSVLTVLLVSGLNLSAQSLPGSPILPLSPNTAELNKYTSIPVNGMTGVPSIGFPLYEINTGKISLPISLNYHASGIKVTQKATWAGLGWSINAGGVISRAIRGIADEEDFNNNGWFNDTTSWTVLDQLWDKAYTGTPQEQRDAYYTIANYWVLNPGHDTHPDFFSYSAGSKSGKFLYSRAKQKFISFPYEPVNINRDALSNTYTVTDDDGTIYFFEAQERIMYYLNYPIGERERVQSWYLSRIVSADRTDTVYLNYDVIGYGYNQERVVSFTKTTKYPDTGIPQELGVRRNESLYYNDVLVLKEILFSQGKVSFFANTVRQDVGLNNANALDSMVVYRKQNGGYERVNKYSFNYDYFTTNVPQLPSDYRLRLLSFKKEDITGGAPVVHRFEYNQVQLPNYTSFSADCWGFYNGSANADLFSYREADTNYVRAGMLQKIIYPTGGYTVFDFESNKYKSDIISTFSSVLTSIRLFGVGSGVEAVKQENFQVPQNAYSQTMSFDIKFSPFVPGGEGIPQQVKLRDLTTGTDIKLWTHTGNELAIQTYSESYYFDRTHQYQFYAMVQNHSSTTIDIELRYTVQDHSKDYRPGAGVRIRNITVYNYDGTVKSQEQYKYGVTEDGVGKLLISDKSMLDNFYNVRYAQTKGPLTEGGLCCAVEYGTMKVAVGNIAYPSFSFMGANILYDFVTKYQIGNGVPNGKTVQQYAIPDDFQLLFNPRLPGGYELMDKSLYGQQLIKETKLAYDKINNNYRPVEEKQFKYGFYNGDVENGIRFWEQNIYFVEDGCTQDKIVCFAANVGRDFHYARYGIRLGCYRLDTIIKKEFDERSNVLQTKQYYEYKNGLHLYPSSIISSNSKGEILKSTIKYPGDHSASDHNSSVLDKMVTLNILDKPYWSGEYNGPAILKFAQTKYDNQWNGNQNLVLPQKQESYINASVPNLADYTEYKNYDIKGNPLLVSDKQGIYTAYIWDYLSTYPVAQITGTGLSVSESAYTSFESDGTGNWNISNSVCETGGITGNSCYRLSNGAVIKSGLTSGTNYIVSYWTTNGNAFTINGTQGAPVRGKTINGWTYFEHKVTSVTEVAIPQTTGLIDEIRLYPADAQATTYTYSPLIGMTSVCSSNNTIVYYEYDGLGRLKLIKDQEGNIIKTMEYSYMGQ